MTPFERLKASGVADFGIYLDAAGRQYSPFVERLEDGTIDLVEVPSPHQLAMPENPRDVSDLDTKAQRFFENRSPDVEMQQREVFLRRYNITPDDKDRWSREMNRLRTSQRGRIRLELSRRYAERYETLINFEGLSPNQDSVYIAEGDNPCEECEPLAGDIMPLSERISGGYMPGDRCLGGDACMCGVSPVD